MLLSRTALPPWLLKHCSSFAMGVRPFDRPPLEAPLGGGFIAPMSPRQLCLKCEVERQTSRAGDP